MRVYRLRLQMRPLPVMLGLTGIAVVVALTISGTTEPIDSYAACAQAGYPISDSNPPLCQSGASNFLGTSVAESPPVEAITSVPFETLVDGDTHAPTPPYSQTVIGSQTAWQAYWARAHTSLPVLPPLIPVDFKTATVIATSLGEKPNTGYGLSVTSISSSPAGSVVDITESTPTVTCPVSQLPTNRYLIVQTLKLSQPVSFRITKEMRHCQ
jgi:hypothetical protein